MIVKIILLTGCVLMVWLITRLRKPRNISPPQKNGEALVRCQHCGVYHESKTPCQCQKKT